MIKGNYSTLWRKANLQSTCDQCDQSQSTFITEKTPKSQGIESEVNKEGLITENITPQGHRGTGSQMAHRSHLEENFEQVDKGLQEIPMGLNKDWSIKRIGENGDTWLCDCPGCSDNNGGNVITGSIGAIRGHALNHEIVEIQDELERLGSLPEESLPEELKMCSNDTLKRLQNCVTHGSKLEHYLLNALTDIEKRVT